MLLGGRILHCVSERIWLVYMRVTFWSCSWGWFLPQTIQNSFWCSCQRRWLNLQSQWFPQVGQILSFTTAGHFPLSCFDCTVWLLGGVYGSGSKESDVAQQVTESCYALIWVRTWLPVSQFLWLKKCVTLVWAFYCCGVYFFSFSLKEVIFPKGLTLKAPYLHFHLQVHFNCS